MLYFIKFFCTDEIGCFLYQHLEFLTKKEEAFFVIIFFIVGLFLSELFVPFDIRLEGVLATHKLDLLLRLLEEVEYYLTQILLYNAFES